MEEKGIVDCGCLPPEPRCRGTTASGAGSGQCIGSSGQRRGGGPSAAGSGKRGSSGQQFLSPPCRGSVYFRLMWTCKNQRHRRTSSFALKLQTPKRLVAGKLNVRLARRSGCNICTTAEFRESLQILCLGPTNIYIEASIK